MGGTADQTPDQARRERLRPLGFRRALVLDCLHAGDPRAPGYLAVPDGADILELYRAHIETLSRREDWLADRATAALLAAGRLLAGEAAAAMPIADALPERAPTLRFGQAYCPLVPVRTLAAVLPLPAALGPPETWLAGSPEQAALRDWIAEHGPALRWHAAEARYSLPGADPPDVGPPDRPPVPQGTRPVFVSLTRLRIRSWRFMPRFLLHTMGSLRQVRRAAGFRGGSLLADRALVFWTLTAWDSPEAMRAYMVSGAHRAAMPRLLDWCDEAAVAHWEQPDTQALPGWAEADRRLRREGRPSKVRHPGPAQAGLRYAAPRLTAGGPISPVAPRAP